MRNSKSTSEICKIPVIIGPTGSGKTAAAIEIAKKIGGEIISADSRAIYKYMDIGTAKPTAHEQSEVPHFGIDLVEPGERFTVADWKEYAEKKIKEIIARGHVPMIVGGTGLYVDALIFDYQFSEEARENYADRQEMRSEYGVFGILWENNELRTRLEERVNKLFCPELYKETEFLASKYGWDSQAMKSNIYQFAWGYMQGEYTLEEAKRLAALDDYHLAKRQITWFKRNDKIVWLPLEKIVQSVVKYIQDGKGECNPTRKIVRLENPD